MSITVKLTPDQEAWIAARVASGAFASVDDAAKAVIAIGIEAFDQEWANGSSDDEGMDDAEATRIKGLLDEARAQVERGEYLTLEQVKAGMAARRAARRVPTWPKS